MYSHLLKQAAAEFILSLPLFVWLLYIGADLGILAPLLIGEPTAVAFLIYILQRRYHKRPTDNDLYVSIEAYEHTFTVTFICGFILTVSEFYGDIPKIVWMSSVSLITHRLVDAAFP